MIHDGPKKMLLTGVLAEETYRNLIKLNADTTLHHVKQVLVFGRLVVFVVSLSPVTVASIVTIN